MKSFLFKFLSFRLLTPFITEMDENILISSLPFNSDLETLKMHNVGAVVNMCIEYAGPNYPESIVQLRLPTGIKTIKISYSLIKIDPFFFTLRLQRLVLSISTLNLIVDTSAPCLADLEKGIQFIASNLEQVYHFFYNHYLQSLLLQSLTFSSFPFRPFLILIITG